MGAFRVLFTAADYDATVAFYRDTLGLAVAASWDDHGRGTIFVAADGQIEVFDTASGRHQHGPSGVSLAWEVDDVDRELARLVERGVDVVQPPTDQPLGHRNATIADPHNALTITLFQVTG